MPKINQAVELKFVRHGQALNDLADKCRRDMKHRWPRVEFDADEWLIKTIYQTKMLDVRFGSAKAAFRDKDPSYLLSLRCLIAHAALEGKVKEHAYIGSAWRLLATQSVPLAGLRRVHLSELEESLVSTATRASAAMRRGHLTALSRQIADLSQKGVLDRLVWSPSVETKATLQKLHNLRQSDFKAKKRDVLDRHIEAFSEATSAMLKGDPRLDGIDRSVVAATNILMCAPSRINEPLNLKVGDRFTIEAYAHRSDDRERDDLHSTHQLLLMKGSKGAQWSPKPILNFMIGLCDTCWNVLLEHGKRSRMLVKWYEQNPDRIYLPADLEHLRGNPVSQRALSQIINLTANEPTRSPLDSVRATAWKQMTAPIDGQVPIKVIEIENPTATRRDGHKNNANPKLHALPWDDVERNLLARVHERMSRMRKLTKGNHYDGKLSEMLMLVDPRFVPYLPQALDDVSIRSRLKTKLSDIKEGRQPSIFIKLGLRMLQDGREVDCYLEPHDLRRWLTTQALLASERLSDVLINKWANRLDVSQLSAYDFRTLEQKADQSTSPLPQELEDMSRGIQALEVIESQYGLSTEMVVSAGEGITITSMEAVYNATENRPVARTSNQIIILYPTRFGVCLHQHHELPCRAYDCGGGCNEQLTIKGHLPTNIEWRKEAELTHRSIMNQLQALIIARNRGIADEPNVLDLHLLTLVKHGLDARTMANDLIEKFQDIKSMVRDVHFRNELEKAFVARGVVKRLDDSAVSSGAIIKYHNPTRHAAPGLERAIETHFGSRELMQSKSEHFYQDNPEMAPCSLDLKDQRYLLGESYDEDSDDDNYKQVA